MDKRLYLPAIASVLILCLTFASVTPAMAGAVPDLAYARALPTLDVVTIAEDDEARKTGMMVLGLLTSDVAAKWPKAYDADCVDNPECVDKLSQHKILVTFNGIPVTIEGVWCQFIKKEKLHPLQKPQFPDEQLRTVLTDESANFVCKLREGKPGVGVLDVYYIGSQQKQFIADYVMVVQVWTMIGSTVVSGVEVQNVCVLGWAIDSNTIMITKPSGDHHYSWPDALGPFVSCEEAALWQRDVLGLPVLYD